MTTDWNEVTASLKYQMERRRIESNKKDHVHGPYLTIIFEHPWMDQALNYVRDYTSGGELISVIPHKDPLYCKAVFKVRDCHFWKV